MTKVFYKVNETIFNEYPMAKEFAEINGGEVITLYEEHPYEDYDKKVKPNKKRVIE